MEPLNEFIDQRNAEFQVVIVIDVEDGRLSPLTNAIPRALLPIANKKLLSYQLDMLVSSGVTDVIIVAPQEYHTPLRQFKSLEIRDHLNLELVFVENMSGSVDALIAINERIRGEFVCIHGDMISQYNFTKLINFHRSLVSDFTMLLTTLTIEESEKTKMKKVLIVRNN